MFEEVISVAASFLTAFNNADGLMDLHFMSNRPELITAGRGFAQTAQQLEALALLTQTKAPLDDLVQMLSERSRLMSGCLFVFAGMDSERLKLIRAVEDRGVETAIFVVKTKVDDTPMRADFHLLDVENVAADLESL